MCIRDRGRTDDHALAAAGGQPARNRCGTRSTIGPAMNEDLFSQLFELFNQPGPVNWKLAAELSIHLAGDREPIEPWMAEEYQDLGRLAQLQVVGQTPLDPGQVAAVVPTDRRGWADSHLKSLRSVSYTHL